MTSNLLSRLMFGAAAATPGFETPEQFAARKRREVEQQERDRRMREERLRRERQRDPYGDVTMDSQGRPQWRYGSPHVGPRIMDETLQALGNVPGPHRPLTDRYDDIRQMTMGGGSPPMPPAGGGRKVKTTQPQRDRATRDRERVREKLKGDSAEQLAERKRVIQEQWQADRQKMAKGLSPSTTKQRRIQEALNARNTAVSRLLKLRSEWDRATPQRRQKILEEIDGLGKHVDEIDRFLRGPK